MGIINNDSLNTPYGISISGTYVSIGRDSLNISREETDVYVLHYCATIWATKEDRENEKRSLQTISRSVNLTSEQISGGVYILAYNDLKTVFPNNTDA